MKVPSGMRKPYAGPNRNVVIALDVGTTFSGVSYAVLEPGEVPKIHGVTRFPGQEHVAGNSKIPSLLYYDRNGLLKAAGAEAESASVVSLAEDESWVRAELFKLRLRPKSMKLQMNGMRVTPLPRSKTAVDVFGDFLGYLYRCTRNFIIDTHANGRALWAAVENDIQFVLSHPNGWEGAQQTKMRRSAVIGGLIPDTDEGKARIRFVTEGEASLHACVLNGLAADVISSPSNRGFLIADAGGGTLDISSYAIRGTSPLVIDEIAPPDCVFSGSVFVSRRARMFLEEKLKNSKYGAPDSLDHITKRFDETTKRLFRDKREIQFIPFGSPLDKDMAVGIRSGQLKLSGSEVADFFEPSIEAAVASIRAQIDASGGIVKSVWLVGGFAASPWLFSQLQERLAPLQVTVNRPDSQTSKAVADGAIGFFCDHHVSARMSKYFYGIEFLRDYDPKDKDHVGRKHRLCELPSGPKLLRDAFDCILPRNVTVKESTVFTRKYCTELLTLSMLSYFEVELWCYRGRSGTIPTWIHRDAEDFSTLCIVRADLSQLKGSAEAKQGPAKKTYWRVVFSIEIHFGLTEFKARLKWLEDGKTRYGPASIVYSESGLRVEESDPDSAAEDDPHAGTSKPRWKKANSSASPPPRSRRLITPSDASDAVVINLPKPRTTSLDSPITPTEPASPGLSKPPVTRRSTAPEGSVSPSHDTVNGVSYAGEKGKMKATEPEKGAENESFPVPPGVPAPRKSSETPKMSRSTSQSSQAPFGVRRTSSSSVYVPPPVKSAHESSNWRAKSQDKAQDIVQPSSVEPQPPSPIAQPPEVPPAVTSRSKTSSLRHTDVKGASSLRKKDVESVSGASPSVPTMSSAAAGPTTGSVEDKQTPVAHPVLSDPAPAAAPSSPKDRLESHFSRNKPLTRTSPTSPLAEVDTEATVPSETAQPPVALPSSIPFPTSSPSLVSTNLPTKESKKSSSLRKKTLEKDKVVTPANPSTDLPPEMEFFSGTKSKKSKASGSTSGRKSTVTFAVPSDLDAHETVDAPLTRTDMVEKAPTPIIPPAELTTEEPIFGHGASVKPTVDPLTDLPVSGLAASPKREDTFTFDTATFAPQTNYSASPSFGQAVAVDTPLQVDVIHNSKDNASANPFEAYKSEPPALYEDGKFGGFEPGYAAAFGQDGTSLALNNASKPFSWDEGPQDKGAPLSDQLFGSSKRPKARSRGQSVHSKTPTLQSSELFSSAFETPQFYSDEHVVAGGLESVLEEHKDHSQADAVDSWQAGAVEPANADSWEVSLAADGNEHADPSNSWGTSFETAGMKDVGASDPLQSWGAPSETTGKGGGDPPHTEAPMALSLGIDFSGSHDQNATAPTSDWLAETFDKGDGSSEKQAVVRTEGPTPTPEAAAQLESNETQLDTSKPGQDQPPPAGKVEETVTPAQDDEPPNEPPKGEDGDPNPAQAPEAFATKKKKKKGKR